MDNYALSLSDLADLFGITRQGIAQMASKLESQGLRVIKNKKQITHLPPETVREILLSRGYKYQNKSIAFQVIKGGVGKTSISKNFGIRAAQYGYKVLFVDFDHQANLTFSLNKFDVNNRVFIDFLKSKSKLNELILDISEHIAIIPSSLANARLDSELLTNTFNLNSVIRDPFLELKQKYDLIVCDCPPALGPTVSSVYLGVDEVIAPMVPDKFSEMAVDFMLEEWKLLSTRFKNVPKIKLLINRHDPRLKTSNEQLIHLVTKYTEYVCPTAIRSSVDFISTTNNNQHLWESKKSSTAAEDVDLFVRHDLLLSDLTDSKTTKKDMESE